MTRILLVDDSPHAQRIGERILSEEGFEVVTVSNADTALVRLEDVDPDVVVADAVMPGRTGLEICQYIRMNPRFRHVRVILTAGVLETVDEEQVRKVAADGSLKKPFEASLLVGAVRPLAEAARVDRERFQTGTGAASAAKPVPVQPAGPFVAVVEPEQVRAAVTIALDASMETMVEEITRRVMAALAAKPKMEGESAGPLEAVVPAPAATPKPAPPPESVAVSAAPAPPEPIAASASAAPPPAESPAPMMPKPAPPMAAEPVRRVHALRMRHSTSILGLEPLSQEDETPPPGDN